VLPRRTRVFARPDPAAPGARAALRVGLIAGGAVAAVAFVLPIAGAEDLEGRSIWRPSTWTGVVAGAPVPGEGLPVAAMPAAPVALPPTYDLQPEYEGQAQCDPTPKPGTQALADLIKATYGSNQTVWIPRNCNVGGQSEHKEGRAIDWMTDVRNPQGRANAETFLNWLLGPDEYGVAYGNAQRLGVMYIGWNDRIWRGYDVDRGWTELKGCFTRSTKSADTVCHRNHIHISLTWDGASGRTSFWTGQPSNVPFCPRARTRATTTDAVVRGSMIAVEPVRVLNTLAQTGVDTRCRLQRDRYSSDNRRLFPKVVGVGGVPADGVSGVLVRVTSINTNAPTSVRVWAPGQKSSTPVAKAPINGTASSEVVVPVASDGTIALAMQFGAADIAVDVLGYFGNQGDPIEIPAPVDVAPPALDVPVAPPAAPTPDVPGAVPPAAPAPEFAGDTTGFVAVGNTVGYESAGTDGPLQPGEARVITLAGVPAEATAALVAVTTIDGTRKGSVQIGPAQGAPVAKVKVRKAREITSLMMLPVNAGAVSVTNSKRPQVNMRMQVLGFSTNATPPQAVARPATPLFRGKSGANEVRVLKAANRAGLPKRKNLKAVLMRVTTRGAADGEVTITAHGAEATPSSTLPMVAKQRNTYWLLVPTNDSGNIAVKSSVRGAVRGDVVGFVR